VPKRKITKNGRKTLKKPSKIEKYGKKRRKNIFCRNLKKSESIEIKSLLLLKFVGL